MQHYPFQLRDHGDKVIEMIVSEPIVSGHRAIDALNILLGKFDFVIFSLPAPLEIEAPISQYTKKADSGELLLVIPEDKQIKTDICGIKRFRDLTGAHTRVRGERNISKVLKQISNLAPLKSSAHKILHMLRNPEVAFEDIEEVTAKDPKLVMRMLKIANSAFFMRRMPLENLSMVVAFLGIEGIRQILMQEAFDGFSVVFANQRDKLAHMRRCSHLSTHIGKLLGCDQNLTGKMRSAGLLHDLGSLALCFFDNNEYARVTMKVRNDRKTICQAEMDVFGVDHQELGVILAKELGMPDYLSPVMAQHHEKNIPKDAFLLMSVIIANGFLNEHVEKLSFTPYEHFFPILAQERIRIAKASGSALKSGDEEKEIFKIPVILDVLKKELDQFILSGPEAQGM
jgi:HD-like signal output (HDOD) protein